MMAPASSARATTPRTTILSAASAEDAVAALERLGADAAPIAGATWIMRGSARDELPRGTYVDLRGIPELRRVAHGDPTTLGAMLCHTDLAALGQRPGPLGALAHAAASSAFPAVRNVATLGGNLVADPFPESDLIPALLALAAEVQVVSPGGRQTLGIERYLATRRARPVAEVICGVRVAAPPNRRSWYQRLTVRGGGEYAVASIALAVDVDAGGVVTAARMAAGGVEAVARRADATDALLVGRRLTTAGARAAATALAGTLSPREGHDAPAWYRTAVLPALAERVAAVIIESEGRA